MLDLSNYHTQFKLNLSQANRDSESKEFFTSSSNNSTSTCTRVLNDTVGGGFMTGQIRSCTSLITGLTDMGKPYRITIVRVRYGITREISNKHVPSVSYRIVTCAIIVPESSTEVWEGCRGSARYAPPPPSEGILRFFLRYSPWASGGTACGEEKVTSRKTGGGGLGRGT